MQHMNITIYKKIKSYSAQVPTFPHVPKRILIGFIRAHLSLHLWCVHAGLVG